MGFADEVDQGPRTVLAGLACDGRGTASAFEEAVYAAGPVFHFDVDRGLEFARVMSVAGRVTYALKGKVTGVIVMDEDVRDVPFDIAGSDADAQNDQERDARQVEPTGAALDAASGFVEVFDRGHGSDPVWIRSTMSSKRCAVRWIMAAIVAVEIGKANQSLIRSASLVSGLT